ncbi:uncharacterized protein LOC131214457 [Anopheles bellator]|uniref:uncharacterized protein LOC131214457 n=1 Tax=Anopheles bellator TaxID=139047 RepID=UPI002648ECBE|nr:uncharacterized protein LOC131214457 [Anopheles bellator]
MHRPPFRESSFMGRPLHRAAVADDVEAAQQCIAKDMNPYQPTEKGLTPLYVAIGSRAEGVVRLLLDRYEADMGVVRETIKHRFLWKVESTGWRNRPILIAWTDTECQEAVELASNCPAGIPLNVQVFVWLRTAYNGHRFVALDVCNRSRMMAVYRFIHQLLPNGVLSLDRRDYRENFENYLRFACQSSTVKIVELLIAKGTSLDAASGEDGKTPFMAACVAPRKDIVEVLLSKYGNRFDPNARDRDDYNAVHMLVQRQKTDLVEKILEQMVRLRVARFRETETQAFNKIFPRLSEYSNSWHLIRSPPMKKLFTKYTKQYKLDLKAQCGETTLLATLIHAGVALDYCFEAIRNDLELLRLQDNGRITVLHYLIIYKHTKFVAQLYRDHGTFVRDVFETDDPDLRPGNLLLRLLLQPSTTDEAGVTFVLQHHREFFARDIDQLRKSTVEMYWFREIVSSRAVEVLANAIPELNNMISEVIKLKQANDEGKHVFYEDVRALSNNFTKTVERLESNGKLLEEYLDKDGRTLFHVAVDWNDRRLVERLLERKFDLLQRDAKGCLPIHYARSESIFELLLAKDEEGQLTSVTDEGYNLLQNACTKGFRGSDVMEKLLNSGMDVNEPATNGQLPLSLAGCCGTVSFLLKHGARPELLNEKLLESSFNNMRYCSAWQLIPRIAHFDWFRKIAHKFMPWMVGGQNRDFFSCSNERELEKYDDIRRLLFDSLYEHSKEEASELFARVCHRAIVSCSRWFLDYDYDLNYDYTDYMGYTPLLGLLSYMEEPNFDIVERLLRKPVNVNAVTDRKQTALIIFVNRFRSAKWYGHSIETVHLLLNRGVKIDAQDEDGNTALHLAFENAHWDVVECLIESNANVGLKNAAGKVPCEMAPAFSRFLYGFMKSF